MKLSISAGAAACSLDDLMSALVGLVLVLGTFIGFRATGVYFDNSYIGLAGIPATMIVAIIVSLLQRKRTPSNRTYDKGNRPTDA